MSSTRMDFDSTLALIRKARPVVNINRGFEAQLRAYSQSNYDVYVAQQILLRGRIRTLYSLHCEAQRSALSQSPIRDLIGNSGGSNNSSGRMPMRKRSKDFTNDEMLLKLVQDEKDALAEEELRGGHEEEEEEENYNYDRDQLRMKKAPSAQPVSLTNLRALIPLINAKTPNVRLTRPGSQAVRIIPPLRGLGREFCCSWCGKMLFNLANVIRLDVDAAPLVGLSASSAAESKEDLHRLSSRSSSGAVDPIFDGSGNIGLPLSSDNSPSLSDPAAKKTAAGLSSMRVPPPTSRYKQRKGFDFKDICANLPSYSSEDSELKSDSKGVDDEDENGGGVITTQRSYSDDKDHCADEALDKVSVHIPPQSSQQHSSVGRQSGRFVVTGPVDDDDTMSLASSQGGNSSIIIENSPPITRKNGKVFPLHLQLNSRSASPFNGLYSTRSMESEDSPRIPIPPHRMNEEFSPRQGPYWYRPQSAEKSRWLARVSLLQGGSISRVNSNSRVARMAQEDEEAVRLGWGGDKYVHLEYLEWMGQEALQGHKVKGPLHCSGCQNVLGVYDWSPNERCGILYFIS